VVRLKAVIMAKLLQDYTKEELIEQIKSLKKTKKFGLVWEDKPEQVAIDCETKLPVLTEVTERAITKADDQPTNLIIEGDNYHSLSTLNYTHANSIDVIYIDPPYNTGSNDFMYNDRYVDTEDGFRHSKWLSFMAKRLKLVKNLLTDNGVIFISISDHEQAHLRVLCDEIFGYRNFVNRLTWESTTQPINTGKARFGLQKKTELIFCYAKNKNLLKPFILRVIDTANKYPHQGKFGACRLEIIEKSDAGSYNRESMKYEILGHKPRAGKRWQIGEDTAKDLVARGRIEIVDGIVKKAVYPEDELDKVSYKPFWAHLSAQEVGTAQNAKDELNTILGRAVGFDTVKPMALITELISHFNDDVTVLDFFAGSGTTGHAILKMNAEDNGSRKFILCTDNENGIAENITVERIKKAINGYDNVSGISANLRYFKTSFVDKAENTDHTRVALVARATDMIKVRENTFDTVLEEDLFKAYEGSDTYSVIVFDPSVIDKAKAEITKLSDDKAVRVYVFSLANDSYVSDFADLDRQVELCPIPESILEVYKRIFDQKGTK